MHALPAAKAAQATARAFTQSLPEDKQPLLAPIIDHFAYLETYGYKIAYSAGVELGDKALEYNGLSKTNLLNSKKEKTHETVEFFCYQL